MSTIIEWLKPVWQPHVGQAEFLLSQAKTKVLACGRRWGKTEACAAAVAGALRGRDPTRHLLVAPTLDQARILFDRVVSFIEKLLEAGQRFGDNLAESIVGLKNTPYPQFSFGPHKVMARSGHLARALRGNEATQVIVDEAAYTPEELINEVLAPMLATNDGDLTLISTPHGMNHFWRYFKWGERGEFGVWSRTAPSRENPMVSQRFLDSQRALISERAFATEYEAAFMDVAGQVFRQESIEACLVPSLAVEKGEQTVIGIDWGRYEDFTTVAVMRGTRSDCVLLDCYRLKQQNWASQLDVLGEVFGKHPNSRILVDGTGTGQVLFEKLCAQHRSGSIGEFKFTNESKARLIDNLACIFDHRWIQMLPNPELMRELQFFEHSRTRSGKASFNARSGYHDDLVIALALAAIALPESSASTIVGGTRRAFSVK